MDKGEVKLSPAMSEIVKAVQQSKWTLMRVKQQQSRGYKEVRQRRSDVLYYHDIDKEYVID